MRKDGNGAGLDREECCNAACFALDDGRGGLVVLPGVPPKKGPLNGGTLESATLSEVEAIDETFVPSPALPGKVVETSTLVALEEVLLVDIFEVD